MTRRLAPRLLAPLTLVVLLLPACGNSVDQASPKETEPPIPNGAVAVTGTSACTVETLSYTVGEDGMEVVEERFSCDTVMSDPRATGAEEYPLIVTHYATGDVAGLWTADGATLTNDDGVWKGSGFGVVDLVGISPLAEGEWPFNYGESHYTGSC